MDACVRSAAAAVAFALWIGPCLPARAVSDEAILAARPPKLLSEFGFFADMSRQVPAARVLPFAPATPLFSDHATKLRFVYVPEGKPARYNGTEAFEFAPGSALVKTFAYPSDAGSPDRLDLVETRVLLRHDDGWNAWAYVWNEEQTDAVLNITGAKREITVTPPGAEPQVFTYSVPNKNQCKGCHGLSGEIVPLGPKARNLNGDHAYPDGTANQLARWTEEGMLAGAPSPAQAPSAVDWTDPSVAIDARARAWLDVNCAHCHRREGPASNSGLFLTSDEQDRVALGVGKRPVAAGRGSGGRQFAISPGRPDESILLYRVESREPGVMMPEIGRVLADPQAVGLLREWIAGMR